MARPAPLRPPALTFAVNGAAYASFLPRLPEVAERLGLGPAALGPVLLGVGLGGLVGSFTAPRALRRWGSATVTGLAGVALAGGLVLLGLAPTAWLLALALAVQGALDGLHDVAMNDLAAAEQERRGRSVMGRLHAAALLLAVQLLARRRLVPVPPHPPLVGALAEATSLTVALALLPAAGLVLALALPRRLGQRVPAVYHGLATARDGPRAQAPGRGRWTSRAWSGRGSGRGPAR